MSVTSCQQRIPLFHVYYNIFPIEVTPSSVQNISEGVIYTFFVLNKNFGLTMQDITLFMTSKFPQYTTSEVETEVNFLIKKGVLVTLQPICRDWCADTCPEKAYAISWRIDQLAGFRDLVLFLLGLAGGTRTFSRTFNRWFLSNGNVQNNTVGSTKRSTMSLGVLNM